MFAGGSVYCATKHAITALSEGLRKELSPHYNIRVTCIEPGAVATELLETITDESMSKFQNRGHSKCNSVYDTNTGSRECQ